MPGSNNRVQFANGYRLEASAAEEWQIMQATATDVSCVNNAGNPEGVVPANMGSLCHDRTNGNLYVKHTGTGTTGWLLLATGVIPSTDLHTARYIVSPGGATDGANYTTIAAAITAAALTGTSQTIFIQPGSYTENLTVPANINMSAYSCDALTPNVTIIGTITCTDAGSRTFSGIRFQTNAATILSITGTAATVVDFVSCNINCTNSDFITSTTTSTSSTVNINSCVGNLGTTGIKYFSINNGSLGIYNTKFSNGGSSVTASTIINGSAVEIENSLFANIITTSNTSSLAVINSDLFGAGLATFTVNGTGTNEFSLCRFESGTASAISIGAGVVCEVQNCVIDSSNTNVITGAGTVEIGGITFAGTSSNINTTTVTVQNEGPSRTIGSANTGLTNTLTVTNSSNTASSNAKIVATVGGTSSADAFYQAVVSGTTTWSWGVDNSDSDAYVLSASATPGTTNVMRVSTAGEINYPLQPAFLASIAAVANVTGDNTVYTLTTASEIFDQGGDFAANTFTAPVTGRYYLNVYVTVGGLTTAMTVGQLEIVTSNRNYSFLLDPAKVFDNNTNATFAGSSLVDMDAGDTATFTYAAFNGTKVADVAAGFYSGYLIC